MATLGTLGLISYLSMGGNKKKEQGPAFNASSKDEENFITYVWLISTHSGCGLKIRRLTVNYAVIS